jgi:hypothetical protein
MSYQSDLVAKLNNVNVTTATTDDLYVLAKAYYEGPVGLANIPKTFVKALKTRLLDAGTTESRDIGLLQKSINYLNFSAFRVGSTNQFIANTPSAVTPAVDDSDLDYPIFTAVYAPRLPDGWLLQTSNNPATATVMGNTIRLSPYNQGHFDPSLNPYREREEMPFQLGDKLSISFNGVRAAIGIANATNYRGRYSTNGPNPNTADNLFTVLSRSSNAGTWDTSNSYGYQWIVVQDVIRTSQTDEASYAYAVAVKNFLQEYSAYFTKFGIPKLFRVRMWGGGGGGGGTSSHAGSPGGGGAYTEAYVTYGDILKDPWVCAGAGGCPGHSTGTTTGASGDGQASRFAGVYAPGGLGGYANVVAGCGEGGSAVPLSDKVLFSASGGGQRSSTTTQYIGGGSAGGPWGNGFRGGESTNGINAVGGGIAGSGLGNYIGGSGNVNTSGWFTPVLSGWVGDTTISGALGGAGCGGIPVAGYASGGFFGGGAANTFTGYSTPFQNQGYGTFGGGGAAGVAGYGGAFGGNGVVIIEWF